jgi:hypothetical protein
MEHLKAQAEGRKFSVYSSSINSTLQVTLLLRVYSTSASCDALFAYVASTYQKKASAIPPLDLPFVGIETFLEGVMFFPDYGQVGGSSKNYNALHTLQTPRSAFQEIDVRLRERSRGFSFLDPHAPCATSMVAYCCLSPYAYTSTVGLRDMGTHGSPLTRVLEVLVKWTQLVRSPTNLQVDPEALSTTQATLSRSRKTCRACGACFSPKSRFGAASRSADRRIRPVIMEDDLPNL